MGILRRRAPGGLHGDDASRGESGGEVDLSDLADLEQILGEVKKEDE